MYLASSRSFQLFGGAAPTLAGFDGVVADDAEVAVHAGPGIRLGTVAEIGLESVGALGLVGFEQPFLFEHDDRRRGEPEDHIGARVVLLGEDAGRDDTGRIAHPGNLDSRHSGLDGRLEGRKLVVLERGIDREARLRLRIDPINGASRQQVRAPRSRCCAKAISSTSDSLRSAYCELKCGPATATKIECDRWMTLRPASRNETRRRNARRPNLLSVAGFWQVSQGARNAHLMGFLPWLSTRVWPASRPARSRNTIGHTPAAVDAQTTIVSVTKRPSGSKRWSR